MHEEASQRQCFSLKNCPDASEPRTESFCSSANPIPKVTTENDSSIRTLKGDLYTTKGAELLSPAYDEVFRKVNETHKSIQEVLANLSKKHTYHSGPRMAGRMNAGSSTITLEPCVVVCCSSRKAFRAFEKRLHELGWCKSESEGGDYRKPGEYSGVHAYYNGLRLAAHGRHLVSIPNLSQRAVSFLGRAEKLHIHIEDRGSELGQSRSGINSLLCCATITKDHEVIHQKVSRVGGLLSILDMEDQLRLSVITAGHSLLEYFLEENSERQDNAYGSDASDDDVTESRDDHTSLSGSGDVLGYIDPAGIKSWIAVEPTKSIAFVKQADERHRQEPPSSADNETTFRITSRTNSADFALLASGPMNSWLRKSRLVAGQCNSYIDSQGSRVPITAFKHYGTGTPKDLVYLILRPDQKATEVDLSPTESTMFVRGQKFRTQELWSKQPLGVSKQ